MFCEHRDACDIYQKCIVDIGAGGRMKYVWILRYCHAGAADRCARTRGFAFGRRPEPDLMPDGSPLGS